MAPKFDTVIVFGATGEVGSTVALEAAKRGAKVYLAVRDPAKPIPKLDNEQGFEKVKADLSDLESVTAAIKQTGAKAAYLYAVMHGVDQKALAKTVKDAGIQHAVLLSSFTIKQLDPHTTTPEELIAHHHAEVEIALSEADLPYTALRPGWFATNLIWQDLKKDSHEVKIFVPDAKFDFITPDDIGRVGGATLVNPPPESEKVVYITGPTIMTKREAWEQVDQTLGGGLKISDISVEEFKQANSGMPQMLMNYMTKEMPVSYPDLYEDSYPLGAKNVQKYTGAPAMSLVDWVKENRSKFE
ncbi:hypothetical protein BT93_L4726 [Corymbia citriodora subsp. variegata]|uniref:NmrA-like domain-containing protein n=1 Tax=Corymbia citriodora subsp. variegata TaxID=360336 RepID=A0A8T0CFM1_CORYI|nr:hypothetical protein BT93_L4726 [Corymbia citriodora subsp. variegata]